MKEFEYNFTRYTLCPYRLLKEKGESMYLGLDCEKCCYYKGGDFITVRCSYDEKGGAE